MITNLGWILNAIGQFKSNEASFCETMDKEKARVALYTAPVFSGQLLVGNYKFTLIVEMHTFG